MLSPEEVNCKELQKKIQGKEDFTLIDVREEDEYEAGYISKAVSIPLNDLDDEIEDFNTSRDIVLYCRSGKRSKKALDFMKKMGFKNVTHLSGGITQWALEIDDTIEVL